jgi:hypothetical protein
MRWQKRCINEFEKKSKEDLSLEERTTEPFRRSPSTRVTILNVLLMFKQKEESESGFPSLVVFSEKGVKKS